MLDAEVYKFVVDTATIELPCLTLCARRDAFRAILGYLVQPRGSSRQKNLNRIRDTSLFDEKNASTLIGVNSEAIIAALRFGHNAQQVLSIIRSR